MESAECKTCGAAVSIARGWKNTQKSVLKSYGNHPGGERTAANAQRTIDSKGWEHTFGNADHIVAPHDDRTEEQEHARKAKKLAASGVKPKTMLMIARENQALAERKTALVNKGASPRHPALSNIQGADVVVPLKRKD